MNSAICLPFLSLSRSYDNSTASSWCDHHILCLSDLSQTNLAIKFQELFTKNFPLPKVTRLEANIHQSIYTRNLQTKLVVHSFCAIEVMINQGYYAKIVFVNKVICLSLHVVQLVTKILLQKRQGLLSRTASSFSTKLPELKKLNEIYLLLDLFQLLTNKTSLYFNSSSASFNTRSIGTTAKKNSTIE